MVSISRKKQFSAILYFRDSGLKFERSSAIQCFTKLKQKIDGMKTENTGNHDHTFFSDIKVLVLTDTTALLSLYTGIGYLDYYQYTP